MARIVRTMLVVSAALLGVAAVACGGGDGDEAAPTATSEPVVAPTSPLPSPTAIPESTNPTQAPAAAVTPPASAPVTATSPQRATLEIRATDAPPVGVTRILITTGDIEVHRSGGADTSWDTVVAGPLEFDLVQITGIEEVLGSAELEPGQYDQVRLAIESVEVTVLGADLQARVPSDKLRIVGGFDLVAGEATILTLDFDAEKSVVIAGPNVIVKPVIKLLVRSRGEEMSSATVAGETEETDEDAVGPTATAVLAQPPADTPTPLAPTATAVPPVATVVPAATPTSVSTATAVPPTATATVEPTPTATPTPVAAADIVDFAHQDLAVTVGTTIT